MGGVACALLRANGFPALAPGLCGSQAEVDRFWEKLTAGGQAVQCGWLKDRFGVSWQVVPTILPELLQDKDPEKARRVMAAMLTMKKIDIAGLQKAYEGR
jgi:predicted 3-demethylubiquinone-9 3-methyltransferase (glyoxalase superfamily)